MKKRVIYSFAVAAAMVLVYACGTKEVKPADTAGPPEDKKEETVVSSAVNGEEVYKKTCVACHQANGEGIAGTFPPLAKSDFLVNKDAVIEQVLKGKTGEMTVNGVKYNNVMPPQAISDEEIAAVLTYVYSSWGNTGAAVTSDEVKTIRSR